MTKNAYIVLSVADIRELLKRAVADQKSQNRPDPRPDSRHCVVIEGISVDQVGPGDMAQIGSASFIIAARKALPLPPAPLPAPPVNALYTFQFHSGGFNQVWATSKRQAIERARKEFPGLEFQPDIRTFKRLVTKKAQEAYWKDLSSLFN
jgi:hypothetical protein